MNWYEAEIAKLERRLKKIEEHPDPRRAKSNKYLYEMDLEYNRQELNAWRDGEAFVYETIGGGLSDALGLKHHQNVSFYGDRGVGQATEAFRAAWDMGYPDHCCDRLEVGLGMVLAGIVPPPSLVLTSNFGCDPHFLVDLAMARHFKVPVFALDVHLDRTDDAIQYLVRQLEKMIQFVEDNVPGARYDESVLRDYQEKERTINSVYREIGQLKTLSPCPVSGGDAFRIPLWRYDDFDASLRYLEAYRDELKQRYESGDTPVKEEKLRFMWLANGPYFFDPFEVLHAKGVSVPYFEFGESSLIFGLNPTQLAVGDETEYGRKLTPLEEVARFLSRCTWYGTGERRVQDILWTCRELRIDGLIHFNLPGCPLILGSSQIVADRGHKELGMQSLMIEGRALNREGWNQTAFETELEDFVNMCLTEKGLA